MLNNNDILKKYGDIIKEEINIKDISNLDDKIKITKIFKPIGSKLSEKFGKDTGKIIQHGKAGNIKELGDNKIEIFDSEWNKWTLEQDEYEIAYEWLEWDDIAIEWDIIAKLDLEITPDLQREGISREISRFINQMRKDADYQVDDKVTLIYETTDKELEDILKEFNDFLTSEALLSDIKKNKNPEWDVKALFCHEERNIDFALKK